MLMTLVTLLTSCRDDDSTLDVRPTGAWVVSVVAADGEEDATMLQRQASYESLTVSIAGRTSDTQTVIVTSQDDWLTVANDTLAADSIIALTTTTNDSDQRREAVLVFTDADNPAVTATLVVSQLSASDNDENGEAAREQLYVGYGYDIYKALENPMAVRTKRPILDLKRLSQAGNVGTYEPVQDCHLARTEVKYVASNDIYAFGQDLTELQTGDADHRLEGCLEECITANSLIMGGKGSLHQQNFGHGSLEKAVAARVIDRGALLDLKRRNIVPFYESFSQRIREIRRWTGEKRRQIVERTLVDFGTHIIIQVDLGGRIDYTFTYEKEGSFNNMEEIRQEVEFTLGRIDVTERTMQSRITSSSKSAKGALTVKGGSRTARQTLENDISGLSPSGQITPSHIIDWLASINYSDAPERDPNLEVIHFELIPLWDVVPVDMRQDFLDVTLRMVQRSDCRLPASFTGTDIYEIATTQDRDLFDFTEDIGQSLCRLLYMGDEPVLEVCSEYVPKIRTDQRVIVAYPIYKSHIRMNQGLFLGDGIHRPAYVGFSGADSYVNPITEYERGDCITTFYYVNGNLLLTNPSNVSGLTGKNRTIAEDVFMYVIGNTKRTPIVKVGSKFWTRCDIDYNMNFSENPSNKRGKTNEHLVDGVLYGRFQYDIGYYQQKDNDWIWGYAPNTLYPDMPNMKWYLPLSDDVQQLYTYLGFNPKTLFKGQASGFNANFNGYYGIHDFVNNTSFGDGQLAVRYKNELNIFATRHVEDPSKALMVTLDRNYKLRLYETVGEWHADYFPIRPVRGWMYEYPTLQTINDNTFQ